MKKTFIELFLIYLFLFHESSLAAPLNPTTEISTEDEGTTTTQPPPTTELLGTTEITPTETTTEKTTTVKSTTTAKPRKAKVPLGHDGVKMIKKKQLLSKEFHKLEEENSINYFPSQTSTTSTTQKSTTATTTKRSTTSSSTSTSTITIPSTTTQKPQPPTMQSKISDINYEIIESGSVTTTSKPEPAAIEIHINVSESFGSESENVEFSLGPQPHHLLNDVTEENKIILGIESNQPIKAINSDDIFIPQIKLESIERDMKDKNNPTGSGRDSDTIFYISNTEVKVGEDGNRFGKKSPGKNGKDVSYIAESYIEVVESGGSTTQLPTTVIKGLPSVVIEPVPENVQISIGELPPQIELKEIDYMPSEEQQSGGVGDIKYGSDLIDEENIKSFDSMYSGAGYPFGNGADSIKFNSMKKDDMAVSVLEPNVYGDSSNGSSVTSEEDPNYIREYKKYC